MRVEKHYSIFMRQPDVKKYVELYCCILENQTNDLESIYYELLKEVAKDRRLFVTSNNQLEEYGKIRNIIKSSVDEHIKKCFITVLFDALMIEKIKTYSLDFEDPVIIKDTLHKYYLKENFNFN